MLIETNTFSTTLEPNLKREAEAIFKQLDLSPTEAISLFYEQVCLRQQLPFELKTPNQITLEAMEDARLRRNLITAKSVEDIFNNIEDDDNDQE